MDLKNLFNPQSIAVVGASPEEGKVGHVIMKNLFSFGYQGKVYLVNPKYDDIYSQKCFHRLSDVKEHVDLAVLAIPADLAVEEVRKNSKKIKNYVIISAGFSETGSTGRKREEELKKLAEKGDLNILGPNCLGFIVPGLGLNVSFAGGLPEKGGISFVSQSGALAVALMDLARQENARFSNIISVGNKMMIGEAELLEFLAKDKETRVIGMYLEGIKNGPAFIEKVSRVSQKKPVIILKAGKNDRSQKAISSHTGAIAGDDEIISAVFQKAGVLRAENLEEFFDYFNLLDSPVIPSSENVAVVTNAGGVGVLTSDAFTGMSVKLAEIPLPVKKDLRKFLPSESSLENPVDVLGDAHEDRYVKTLETVGKMKNVGTIICVLTPQDQTPVERIAEEIIRFKKKTGKLILTAFLGGPRVEPAIRILKEAGISNFKFPDRAVAALDGLWKWHQYKERKLKFASQTINPKRRAKGLKMILKAMGEKRKALYFTEAREILNMYQVNVSEGRDILPDEDASKVAGKLPAGLFPVALKVDSDQVLHKTEKKGVFLGIEDAAQLKESLKKMRNNFPGERLIVQPMAGLQTELIVGIKRDAVFGPVVICGLGGIYTEIFKMADFFVPPLTIAQIEQTLAEGKLGFLFRSTRGQKKYDLEELAKTIQGVSLLAVELPEIKEFDINPLLIYNDKQKSVAVDVKIII